MWASPPGRVPAHNAAPGSTWGGSRAGLLAEEPPHLQGKSGSSSHLSVHPDGRGGQRLTCPLLCTSWSWTPSTPTRPVDSVETSTVTLSSTSLSPTVSPTCPPPLCSSSSHCTPCKAVFQGPKPDGSTWGARMHTHTGLHWCAVPTCRHAHTHSPGTHVHTQSRSPAITDLLPVGPCHCLLALESTAKPWPCVTVPAAAQSPRPHQARETSHDAHI